MISAGCGGAWFLYSQHEEGSEPPHHEIAGTGEAVPRVEHVPRSGCAAAAEAVLPVIVAYLAFPFDIIPDFIPVLGQLDDLVILAAGLGVFLWLTPRDVIEQHLRALE